MRKHATIWLALTILTTAFVFLLEANGMCAETLAQIPATVERVGDYWSTGVIHGWHSNHLLKYKGVLYAGGRVDDPAAQNTWHCSGEYYRREPGGKWVKAGAITQPPYEMLMGPDGRMWEVAPSDYAKTEVLHMRTPLDFTSFEMPYNGTCAYMGASVSREGNFLVLHAETGDMEAFQPNALIGAFFDKKTGKWYKSRFVTPEGRYGYIGIILRGRKALAVLNSALRDTKAVPEGSHYSWRHVRLAYCADLTKGEWATKGFIMPDFGETGLQDLIEGPDGFAYLAYSSRGASSLEEMRKLPTPHYIARIKDDMSTEVFPTGLNAGSTRILVSRKHAWYIMGRPSSGGNLHLWAIDPKNGFKPTKEYELPGTDKLEGYVIHTLCPARFGGEADGDTIHLLTCQYVNDKGATPAADEKATHAYLWHAAFNLPDSK